MANHFTLSGRTIAAPPPPTDVYGAAVHADEPLLYWRLNEQSGNSAADSGQLGINGTFTGSYTRGTDGVLDGVDNDSTQFTNGWARSAISFANPTTYTEESWFRHHDHPGWQDHGLRHRHDRAVEQLRPPCLHAG